MTRPRIRRILFDFDGVLAHYKHERRIAHLARATGTEHEHVRATLFGSGLESEYDHGHLSTQAYLQRLGEGLGATVDADLWIAARRAGSRSDPGVMRHIEALDPAIELGVLTNNGLLMLQAIPRIVAAVFPRLHGRVLCSGGLRMRKPDPRVFAQALDVLGWTAHDTLFVDDKFNNVQGARSAGLHADTVRDGRMLGKVLKRYTLD